MGQKKNYRWLKIALGWSLFVLLCVGGCSDDTKLTLTDAELERIALTQKVELLRAEGEPVLVVGGETITCDGIINSPTELAGMFISPMEYLKPVAQTASFEQFKEKATSPLEIALANKISNILLYQLAKEKAPEHANEAVEKAAEAELRKFILGYGGDEVKADEALKKMGMDRNSFKEKQKRFILIQSYVATILPDNRPITYRELMNCYNNMKDKYFSSPAVIQFRLIDIQPVELKLSDPNQERLEAAKKLANELLQRIRAGEDFGQLAEQYSHGHRRAFGGLWQPLNPQSLVKPYDILVTEAEKLQPGQITGPIEAEEHIFIMKLEDKRSSTYEPFEKVQRQLEEKIITDRRQEAIDKINATVMQHIALEEKKEFLVFCLEKIYRLSKQ